MSTNEAARPTVSAYRPAQPTPSQPAYRTVSIPPTATFPTGQWLVDQAALQARHERLAASPAPFEGWRDRTPTEPLPVVGPAASAPPFVLTNAPAAATAASAASAFPRVSTLPEPTDGREGRRSTPRRLSPRTKVLRRHPRLHTHLRRALAGILIAVALLTGMQLYAAQGISAARQAALAARSAQTPSSPHTPSNAPSTAPSSSTPPALTRVTSPSSSTQPSRPSQAAQPSPAAPTWVTQDTGAAYDRTDPAASPLDLPRCTVHSGTSSTGADALPCLASLSRDGSRAVVLEEDASLTALVRR